MMQGRSSFAETNSGDRAGSSDLTASIAAPTREIPAIRKVTMSSEKVWGGDRSTLLPFLSDSSDREQDAPPSGVSTGTLPHPKGEMSAAAQKADHAGLTEAKKEGVAMTAALPLIRSWPPSSRKVTAASHRSGRKT